MDTTAPSPPTITPGTLLAWVDSGRRSANDVPMIVDVRSAAEFEAVHIRASYHVPEQTLAEHTEDLARHLGRHDRPLVLVCRSGVRAEQARQRLAAVGLDHAHVLDGGIPAYVEAGGEVVRGRSTWALERQVRLAAGSLVLAGLVAGRYLSPRARALSAAIGAGLSFSALTDTCAMGSLLSGLPFNRAAADPPVERTLADLGRPSGGRPR